MKRVSENRVIDGHHCSVEGPNRRGRPLGIWEDRVKDYVNERGVTGNRLEWARKECMDRERWTSACSAHPLGG